MGNEERNMEKYTKHIREKIESNNQWYTGSQFAWAEKESIKRIYDHRFLFFYKIINREIFRKGRISLLDYGCGDGYWSLIFSRFLLCEVTGVDYNPLRVERARSVVKNAKFVEADLRNLNEHLGKFYIVLCNQVIEHIEDDLSFLKNIRNHLKEDGILILGTTNEGCLTQRFRNYITKRGTDHVHFYKEKKIRDKIEKLVFVIKDIYREVFFPGFDTIYYKMTSTDFGFKILELLTLIFPSQCSDYYFECKMR